MYLYRNIESPARGRTVESGSGGAAGGVPSAPEARADAPPGAGPYRTRITSDFARSRTAPSLDSALSVTR